MITPMSCDFGTSDLSIACESESIGHFLGEAHRKGNGRRQRMVRSTSYSLIDLSRIDACLLWLDFCFFSFTFKFLLDNSADLTLHGIEIVGQKIIIYKIVI